VPGDSLRRNFRPSLLYTLLQYPTMTTFLLKTLVSLIQRSSIYLKMNQHGKSEEALVEASRIACLSYQTPITSPRPSKTMLSPWLAMIPYLRFQLLWIPRQRLSHLLSSANCRLVMSALL
jgi:hypothetical protein